MTNKLARPKKAFFLHEKLKGVVDSAKQNFFVMGMILKEIKDKEYFLTLGYETFNSYIADPDIGIKRSSAYHAMAIVNNFEIEETAGIPVSKLIEILSVIDEDNKNEMLTKAKTLSLSDLKKETKLLKGSKPEDAYISVGRLVDIIEKRKGHSFPINKKADYKRGWVDSLENLKLELLEN